MKTVAETSLVHELRLRPDAALAQLRPYRPMLTAAFNWLWIVAALALGKTYGWNVLTIPVAMLMLGIHLYRNAVLGHDGTRYLITRNRRLNDLFVNLVSFWPLFATVTGYRYWHFQHHRWLGTEKDPENKVKCGPRYELPKTKGDLIWQCSLDLIGHGATEVLKLLWVIRPPRHVDLIGPVVWWTVAGGQLIFTGNGYVIPIFIASILTTFWSVFRDGAGSNTSVSKARHTASRPVRCCAMSIFRTTLGATMNIISGRTCRTTC